MKAVEIRAGQRLDLLRGEWALPLEHFSASSLKMALTCPEQYRQRYILGRKERPGAALIQGAADHRAHEHNFTQKIVSGVDLKTPEIVEKYHEAWDDEIATRDEIDWRGGKPDEIRAHGEKMVALYAEEVSPRIQPVSVEWGFELPLDTVPVPLVGRIDLLTGEGGSNSRAERIVERKTSARTEKKPKPAWKLQGRVYQLATAAGLGAQLPLEWHVVTKLKTPTIITPLTPDTDLFKPFSEIEARNTMLLVERAVWQINAMYLKFGPDEPWPGVGIVHDWLCSWCAYQSGCVWVAR